MFFSQVFKTWLNKLQTGNYKLQSKAIVIMDIIQQYNIYQHNKLNSGKTSPSFLISSCIIHIFCIQEGSCPLYKPFFVLTLFKKLIYMDCRKCQFCGEFKQSLNLKKPSNCYRSTALIFMYAFLKETMHKFNFVQNVFSQGIVWHLRSF